MPRRLPLLALAAIAGCTVPTPPRSAPTVAELAAVIARLPRWRLTSDSGEVLLATRTTRLSLGQNRRNIAELRAAVDRSP